jgi:predicted  nucleic acid-binding Zn-ribbon protein
VPKGDLRPGDSINVSRIEFENIESAVRTNRLRIEKLEARMDALQRELAELKKALRRA